MKKQLFLLVAILLTMVVETFAQTKFSEELLGGIPIQSFAVYMIYAYLGMALNLFSDIIRRDPNSATSPEKFELSYWLEENWRRLAIALVLVPVAIVFCKDFMDIDISRLSALLIGLSSDHLLEILKRRNIIKS